MNKPLCRMVKKEYLNKIRIDREYDKKQIQKI